MTVEERDALVMAPVGTPGLEALGLVDAAWADAEHFGPAAVRQAEALWSSWHAAQATSGLTDLVGHLSAMNKEDSAQLLSILGTALGGGDAG